MATLTYLGFTLQLLQVGIIPLLPTIGRELHVAPGATSWLVTAGLLSGAIALAVLTKLADLHGKRPMILLSLVLVLVLAGCVLGSVTSSFPLLIVSRVLMGALLPMLALPEAVANDTMPPRRAHLTIGAIHAGNGAGVGGGLLLERRDRRALHAADAPAIRGGGPPGPPAVRRLGRGGGGLLLPYRHLPRDARRGAAPRRLRGPALGGAVAVQRVRAGQSGDRQRMEETAASRYMLPWLYAEAERTRRLMGSDFWTYGLAGNEPGLSMFLRYSYEQGLAERLLSPEELFAPETLASYVI
jgi:MFS family permease